MRKTFILKVILLFIVLYAFPAMAQLQTNGISSQVSTKTFADLASSNSNQRSIYTTCPGNYQSNFWYFGINAGIDFNSGAPSLLTDGQLNSRKGSCAISDEDGKLLFYTDGVSVWNRVHTLMATGLKGNTSSTQSCLIVQNPGNISKYYIFTADSTNGTNGCCYSEVDMMLNSGYGGVIPATKNTFLFPNHTEKITATRHANRTDIWIVMHESNNSNFRAYHVNASGIANPITSSVGSVNDFNITGSNSVGYMKFSRDGNMLINVYNGLNHSAEIFHFDNATGIITGPDITINALSGAYGAEFSNSGKYVYLSELKQSSTLAPGYNDKGAISQYNLTAGNNAAINASRIELISSSIISYGALQMAPDGKIYVAKENGFNVSMNYLGVINFPETLGTASDYQENGLYLAGKQTLIGLPNFISENYLPTIKILGNQSVCIGQKETYTINRSQAFAFRGTVQGGPVEITWGSSYDTVITVTFKFESPGQIMLKAESHYAHACPLYVGDSILIDVSSATASVDLGNDSTFCYDHFSYELDPGSSYNDYLWNNGSTNRILTATSSGQYWVSVTNANGCKATDTINLNKDPIVPLLLLDKVICPTQLILLNPGTYASYLWQDGSTSSTYTVTSPGIYYVKVLNDSNCPGYDTSFITVPSPLPFDLPNATICPNTIYTLDAGAGYDSYLWQDGSTNQTYEATQAGNYLVNVTKACQTGKDTIILSYFSVLAPQISGLAPSYCISHENIALTAAPTGGSFVGSGVVGSTLHIKELDFGLNNLIYNYTDANNCINRDTAVFYIHDDCLFIPNLITANNDNMNDFFYVSGIGNKFTLEIYNRWGNLVYKKENYDNSFDGDGKNEGVYFYRLYNTAQDRDHKGWIQLIK